MCLSLSATRWKVSAVGILHISVAEQRALTLPDAIRKFTALAAAQISLGDRGVSEIADEEFSIMDSLVLIGHSTAFSLLTRRGVS